jgi:hypothetical protein
MSNRPARISQAEIERAIRAARKAGATEVELRSVPTYQSASAYRWRPIGRLRRVRRLSSNGAYAPP